MCCVGLADTIRLDFDTNHISIRCDHPLVPRDGSNLAFRAAAVFFEQTGIRAGVDITIEKNIPVAGGLGGGSSNAAAILKALNRRFQEIVPQAHLHRMAAGLGADVPFFLYEKPALATGIGDILAPYPLLPQLPVIIINPGFPVPTAEIYKSYSFGLTNGKKTINYSSFTERTVFNAMVHLVNDLEEVTAGRYPGIHRAKQRLLDLGAIGAMMSGSGPSVFGLFTDMDVAERAHERLSGSHDESVFLTKLLTGDDAATE